MPVKLGDDGGRREPHDERRRPSLQRVLETALYVEDLTRSAAFYEELLGLKRVIAADGFRALDAGGGTMLLLFERGSAAGGGHAEGGWIPPHDASGSQHVAFAVAGRAELETWIERIESRGIPIESRVRWPRGGESVYVRDPDGHSVELATPGIWPSH